jgi:hypothetical protein
MAEWVAELHHSELYGVRGLLGLQQAHGRLLQQSGILVVFRKAEAVVLAVVLGGLCGAGIPEMGMGG